MALITLKEVTVAFGGPPVLDKATLSIEKGERACVTGRNGEGKSTLLKLLAGQLEPDEGEVVRSKGLTVAYVGQEVAEAAQKAALSGGQIRRRQLEEAILSQPDLLLLDEPTNHLDVAAIEWLEGCLRRIHSAVLFVTHDRAFLKRVATRVLDLDRGELAGWNCDYATFLRRKADLLADEAVYWERKSKKLAQEEAWIRRGVKARTTRNEGRVAALLKLREEFAARRAAVGTSSFSISSGETSGRLVVKAQGVSFAYPGGERPMVKDFSAKILRGERIGIVGGNGSGKTTLLNVLTGRLAPQTGTVELGTRVEVAYLDQLRGTLNLDKTVLENIAEDRDEVMVAGVRKHVYAYLQDFLFTPERSRTPVRALSGGERARLVLAKRFMDPGNLLVLDEPTNDLDIETLELLEEQLMSYGGTVLLVSHDREFLDHVVTSCFVMPGDGEVLQVAGGYAEASRALAKALAAAPSEVAAASAAAGGPGQQPTRQKKLSYMEQRELAALPDKIAALEKEIADIESAFADPAFYVRDPSGAAAANTRLDAARAELDAAETRWLELSEFA